LVVVGLESGLQDVDLSGDLLEAIDVPVDLALILLISVTLGVESDADGVRLLVELGESGVDVPDLGRVGFLVSYVASLSS
jgi:hypothetical protein